MELFYSTDVCGSNLRLGPEESNHCIRVLRKRVGDRINVTDGEGNLYVCTIADDSPKSVAAVVVEVLSNWHSHDYYLTMAVCPTKNNDRFEWFAEKATEMGVDVIVPVIGDHSERKVFKTDRLRKIVLAATKQSLKSRLPKVRETLSVREFIKETAGGGALKLIACCFESDDMPRRGIKEVLSAHAMREITVLIGPEGDFSQEEAALAVAAGFIPVHLGQSRLRTETAALSAVAAVYFENMK